MLHHLLNVHLPRIVTDCRPNRQEPRVPRSSSICALLNDSQHLLAVHTSSLQLLFSALVTLCVPSRSLRSPRLGAVQLHSQEAFQEVQVLGSAPCADHHTTPSVEHSTTNCSHATRRKSKCHRVRARGAVETGYGTRRRSLQR